MKKPEIGLKPCPFCGYGKISKFIAPLRGTVMFVCEKCGADVCFYGAEHDPQASISWNRRTEK
ncbi:MAG: Lar family restriction alleviation protein [Ruminococcus sp.]|nr:Lar family restriction alleviation protein [Ruminococcus sp.]